MDTILREAVMAVLASSRRKRVDMEMILKSVHQQPTGLRSDFEINKRLLSVLQTLSQEDLLRLPASKQNRNPITGLPKFVTAVRADEDAAKLEKKKTLDRLRHETAWEPTRMAPFAHTLKDIKELKRAKQVNRYLLKREPGTIPIPHRERALSVFGDEKALDRYIRQGMFGGRILLADLDCFYCPEPLPFHSFSLNPEETRGKPLLVVENSNTYWSCCRANDMLHHYAAIVYGQGFHACAAERASDGLWDIERRTAAECVAYFGDLDPAGISIPLRINSYRQEKKMSALWAERRLYRTLLQKDITVPYARSQKKDHDPELARKWLGNDLSDAYLKKCHDVRWPQEGLSVPDIMSALRVT